MVKPYHDIATLKVNSLAELKLTPDELIWDSFLLDPPSGAQRGLPPKKLSHLWVGFLGLRRSDLDQQHLLGGEEGLQVARDLMEA